MARWEEFFSTTHYRLSVMEVSTLYPEMRSVYVCYSDLDRFDPDMAILLLQQPDRVLRMGGDAMMKMMPPDRGEAEIHLRMVELPRDCRVEIRQLRSKHLGKLISVEGLVRKATEVRPRLTRAMFSCVRCGHEIHEDQKGMNFKEPLECYKEQGGCEKTAASTKFVLLPEKSVYVDTQKVEVQESPEGLRGGSQPERLAGFLEDDIAGRISPGDRIVLNGVLRSVQKGSREKSTLFDINLDVLSAESEQHEYEEIDITEEDEALIREEAASPAIFDRIVASISPTIYGYDVVKESLALQLCGGVEKQLDDGTRIRGDIHVLLVGDPGVAKSQLLRYMSSLAPRGIYASGKSSSAAGLCVHPDTLITVDGIRRAIGPVVESLMRSPTVEQEGVERQDVVGHTVTTLSDGVEVRDLRSVWRLSTPTFLVEIDTGQHSIQVTPETRLMTADGGWVMARDIVEGEALMTIDGPTGCVAVRRIDDELPDHVYDLTVDGAHSFLANGLLVHNTAAAVKDDFGEGRWTLEAGALVLADKGVACIDELDKMTDQDRSSMHEAMESQCISVAKAGITATLQCRCSILGAANPKYGRFEEHENFAGQINLPPALMSRFDLIFALTDKQDAEKDRNITEHILSAHRRGQVLRHSNPRETLPEIPVDVIMDRTSDLKPVFDIEFLRKYVAYSKRILPVMDDTAADIIKRSYLSIRKMGEAADSSVPITARQLEAFVRLSEASARVRLSQVVEQQDADRAVRVVEYYLRKIAGDSGSLDIDNVMADTNKSQRDQIQNIRRILRGVGGEGVPLEDVIEIGMADGIPEDRIRALIRRLKTNGEIYEPAYGYYRLTSERME